MKEEKEVFLVLNDNTNTIEAHSSLASAEEASTYFLDITSLNEKSKNLQECKHRIIATGYNNITINF